MSGGGLIWKWPIISYSWNLKRATPISWGCSLKTVLAQDRWLLYEPWTHSPPKLFRILIIRNIFWLQVDAIQVNPGKICDITIHQGQSRVEICHRNPINCKGNENWHNLTYPISQKRSGIKDISLPKLLNQLRFTSYLPARPTLSRIQATP